MALLKLQHLKKKYSIESNNIVHVGAHRGQEVKDYVENFLNPTIHLFEPQRNLFKYLQLEFGDKKNIKIYNFGLGSSNKSEKMFLSDNDGQSSSFLEPKKHLEVHPEVKFSTNDSFFEIKIFDELEINNVDFLNIDTQGYELEVLKGFENTLTNSIKYVILEINKKELYEGCPLVKDIDNYLKEFNFIRTDTHYWMDSYPWGDAFYIKKDLLSKKRILFSRIKNILYSYEIFYKSLIITRNIFWKIRRKHS
jgi:FkbM family methyltransferase